MNENLQKYLLTRSQIGQLTQEDINLKITDGILNHHSHKKWEDSLETQAKPAVSSL